MKRKFVFLFFALSLVLRSYGLAFILFNEEGKQGIKDENGKVVIPAKYDQLGWSRAPFQIVGRLIGYKEDNAWGLLNLEDERITEAMYSQLYPSTTQTFVVGKIGKVAHRDYLGLINSKGKLLIPFKYTSVNVADKLAIVGQKSGRDYTYGVVTLSDKVVIPVEYHNIQYLGADKFLLHKKNKSPRIALSSGEVLYEIDSLSQKSGHSLIYRNQKVGALDTEGNLICPIAYSKIWEGEHGLEKKPLDQWLVFEDKNTISDTIFSDVIRVVGPEQYVVSGDKLFGVANIGEVSGWYHFIGAKKANLLPVKLEDKWGVVKTTGQEVLSPKFDSVRIDGKAIFAYLNTKGWSLYDTFGIQKTGYFEAVGNRINRLFAVKKNAHWGFINSIGEQVIDCVYDDIVETNPDRIVVKLHGEVGIIDKYDDWVVKPVKAKALQVIDQYYYLSYEPPLNKLYHVEKGLIYFTENRLTSKKTYLLEHLDDGAFWKINLDGQIARNKSGYEEIRQPSEGYYAIKKDGAYGFIDDQNRLRIANRYDSVKDFHDGLAAFKLIGKWGFLNKSERIVVQPVYDKVSDFRSGLAIAQSREGAGLINKTGDKVSVFGYDDMQLIENGKFIITKNGRQGLLSGRGKLILHPKYEAFKILPNHHYIIKQFGKYGLADPAGLTVIPVIYDNIVYDPYQDRYFALKKSEPLKVPLK